MFLLGMFWTLSLQNKETSGNYLGLPAIPAKVRQIFDNKSPRFFCEESANCFSLFSKNERPRAAFLR